MTKRVNASLAMVDGDIGRMLRSEAGNNPTVKMLGSLAQVLIFNPFHTVTVLLQVASIFNVV